MISVDSENVLKGISNSSMMYNTSHITQMLEGKIKRLESRGKKILFFSIPVHCGIEVMRGMARRQSSQSKKAGILN
jgi:hypothetical protein